MKKKVLSLTKFYLNWSLISVLVGVACGIASAIFLTSLAKATETREHYQWLHYLLPLGGLIVGYLYHIWGKSVEGGNNLIIDEFHDPQKVVPIRMAPLVLLGTVATHLFGGSAGREGTAVQMGGSIADQFTHFFKLNRKERRTLLMIGMSGGFGSVFGVPFAGTMFGLEVLAIGKLHLHGLFQCAISAFVAHYVTTALGVHHTAYLHPLIDLPLNIVVVGSLICAGLGFGLAARLFAFLVSHISKISKSFIGYLPIRIFTGGVLISIIFYLIPAATRYAGLGVPVIVNSIQEPVFYYDWFWKLVLTALTLGMGFKGGEVTPLLFIGATLGNAMSSYLPISLPILSAVGFVGVFAGAANTPFACTIMAMELFGVQIGSFAAIAAFSSYLISGHHGIYSSQKIHIEKSKYASRTMELISFIFNWPNSNKGKIKKPKSDGHS